MITEDMGPAANGDAGIAVVLYSNSGDRWRSLEQGVRQACLELGIERPIFTEVKAGEAESQAELLLREVSGGAKGLLVACGPDESTARYLDAVADKIPIVLVGDKRDSQLAAVAADPSEMARALAVEIAGATGHIALLSRDGESLETAQRTEAFIMRMEELGKSVTLLEPVEGQDLTGAIASTLAMVKPDLLVVLENDLLEAAIDAVPASMVDVRLCGVGSSEKVVHAMDQGLVTHLVFQNEYAMGYLAVMELADQMGIGRDYPDTPVQYRAVSHETMYQREPERLLFPITQ